MTPSLVPRSALMQGIVSGIAVVIGYALGSLASAIIRTVVRRELPRFVKRLAWGALAGSTLVAVPVFSWFGARWQNDLRSVMEMGALGPIAWLTIVALTVAVALVILFVARLIRGLTRGVMRVLDRILPHQVTVVAGLVIVAVLLVGLVQGVLFNALVSTVHDLYASSDQDTRPWISPPISDLRAGGPDSAVAWDSLGLMGRDFTGSGGGPTAAEIEEFTGETTLEPVRIYVGLRSADKLDDRIDLALRELERTGAFDRSVLVVNTTTGTGWVDENVADSIEFLHGGDTAQVALQYSYLPSWVSFLADHSKAAETGEQLITAVVDRVESMPERERPKLLVFGESLGSFGTEAAFTSPENMLSNVDGAMLVGPTFLNEIHNELRHERDDGCPYWRPVVDSGETYRFAVDPADLTDPDNHPVDKEWLQPRIAYLQNSSDPITYFDPDLILTEPEWLRGKRGPDVSPDAVWFPFVSFFQVAADMAFAMSVPDGHGHRYGSHVVDGWVQTSAPKGWSDAQTETLRNLIEERAEASSHSWSFSSRSALRSSCSDRCSQPGEWMVSSHLRCWVSEPSP